MPEKDGDGRLPPQLLKKIPLECGRGVTSPNSGRGPRRPTAGRNASPCRGPDVPDWSLAPPDPPAAPCPGAAPRSLPAARAAPFAIPVPGDLLGRHLGSRGIDPAWLAPRMARVRLARNGIQSGQQVRPPPLDRTRGSPEMSTSRTHQVGPSPETSEAGALAPKRSEPTARARTGQPREVDDRQRGPAPVTRKKYRREIDTDPPPLHLRPRRRRSDRSRTVTPINAAYAPSPPVGSGFLIRKKK